MKRLNKKLKDNQRNYVYNQRIRGLKRISFLIILSLTLVACSNKDVTTTSNSGTTVDNIYDAQRLSAFDGKNGNPAYIAVNGVVYDVTDQPMWKDGIHRGTFQAGQDLTEEMKGAPHGFSKLTGLKEVGTYE